jgi:prepilin-type N-terminal cleavage/methylation domain-containing protein
MMRARSTSGFTLVELLIAAAISGVVMVAVVRLYVTGMQSYNLQAQITEMNQNAQYTLQLLFEEIQQAGVDLPDTIWPVLSQDLNDANKDSIAIYVNPDSALYKFPAGVTTQKIPLSDASGFVGTTSILRLDSARTAVNTIAVTAVDTAPNPDTIRLAASTVFKKNDIIYNYKVKHYFMNGHNFCRDTTTNILAENIDSLAFRFHNKSKGVVGDWKSICSCRLYVRARTAQPDPHYKNPTYNDGYRRVALTNEFRLRNKF